MYNKTIIFTFDSEKTYKSFYVQFFNGIDENIIEAMECAGSIVDLFTTEKDNNTIITISFREEV